MSLPSNPTPVIPANLDLGGINHSAVANRYRNLTKEAQQNLYQFAIIEVLSQIREERPDKNLDAYNALIGIDKVTTVDIYTYGATNMFFMPDARGSKTGILVNLNSPDKPYTNIQQPSDFNNINDESFRQNFTSWEKRDGTTYSGVDTALDGLQEGQGGWNLGYFNQKTPRTINISELSKILVERLDYHVSQENNDDQILSTLLLDVLPRSAKGAAREPLGVSASGIPFQLEFTFEGFTSPTDELRAIQSPFSHLAKYFDLLVASTNGSDLQDVEYSQEQAENIGAWIDSGTQLLMSASGIGAAVSVIQGAAGLTADAIEGKEIDPLDVISLSLAAIPGGKIVAKLSKVSKNLGQVVRGGISIAETGVDIVGSSRDLIEGFKKGNFTDIINGLVSVASSSASGRPGKSKIGNAIKKGNPDAPLPTRPTYRNHEGEVRPIPTAQTKSFFERVAIVRREGLSGRGAIGLDLTAAQKRGAELSGMGGTISKSNPNGNVSQVYINEAEGIEKNITYRKVPVPNEPGNFENRLQESFLDNNGQTKWRDFPYAGEEFDFRLQHKDDFNNIGDLGVGKQGIIAVNNPYSFVHHSHTFEQKGISNNHLTLESNAFLTYIEGKKTGDFENKYGNEMEWLVRKFKTKKNDFDLKDIPDNIHFRTDREKGDHSLTTYTLQDFITVVENAPTKMRKVKNDEFALNNIVESMRATAKNMGASPDTLFLDVASTNYMTQLMGQVLTNGRQELNLQGLSNAAQKLRNGASSSV
ncbi:hypothetical protein VIBNISFn27_p10180 [Vibrio nigripulchritudo SFn27]|uniref:Uncharacterized protein n=1 Tax=Vibrio nigripulchritudo TaxID=28173 RepID=A0A9P1JM64_9VIBR|nr:hypothetical protein [Vibrio nigripulchritudo]5M41_A Chain A, Nigritoxine [Vibrio nigripulchritudo]CBJ93197.1 Protein of unknown function [Vibrio nigripulchritudo]CCN38718.1 hypothetical protein VIBNIAM115_p0130 [Vibrio nigripulchritudo AM115]CCN45025.1 hypothetical protein VIBNIFTn2_p0129 [Vibrio nigripulchritudo FTn2]CCN79784.1 hypothetical protein VIBNISO65_p0132 [Vibrio nigripulchritudo SO65]CCN92009.1 hypothetical protein VIBNISFn27_p10180 [Vibrio nigripulchritudo SFn27]